MSLSERFIVPGRYIGKITDSFFAGRFFRALFLRFLPSREKFRVLSENFV